MADNVQLPVTGTGTADVVVASDDVTSVHYPFVKLVDGTLGSTAKIAGDATNGLDVDVTRVSEAQSAAQTATWTSGTAADAAVTLAVAGYASAILTLTTDGGTCSIGEAKFEGTADGSDWFALLPRYSTVAPQDTPSTVNLDGYDSTAMTEAVAFGAAGLHSIRLRLSVQITGTISIDVRLQASTSESTFSADGPRAVSLITGSQVIVRGNDGSSNRTLKTDASGELQVDVLTIAAGDNNIGNVDIASIAAGDNNIGNVDVLTVPADPFGANADAASATGSISAKLRSIAAVQLPAALAAGGGLKVEGVAGGVAVPISVATIPSHAVTLASTTITGDVTVIGKAADGAAVSGNPVLMAGQDGTNVQSLKTDTSGELQVDVLTLPNVTIGTMAALVAGTAEIGKLAAGTANIGDVDVLTMPNVTLAAGTNTNEVVGDIAHDTGVGGNPVLLAGVSQDMDDTAPPNQVNAESDTTRLAVDRDGALFVRPFGPRIWSYHENSSSALTDTSVHAAPASGLSLYVTDIVFSTGAATACNIFFEEGASTVLGPYYLEAVLGRGIAIHFTTPKKITAATALTVTTSAAIAHAIDVTGFTAAG